MVAAMLGQHSDNSVLAVCAAVHLHGLAGDVMLESVGEHSMVATDLLRGLPEAFWRAQKTGRQTNLLPLGAHHRTSRSASRERTADSSSLASFKRRNEKG
jgi:hypothetical protein